MRLNRYLSLCGLGSRRGCEVLIQEGRVSINGHLITDLATQVTDEDRIIADGKPVKAEGGVVIALNKPRGYICSRSDERDRMTIYSLLPKQFQSLHHVGRLDKDSEGLLLMTNRGELSHRLIHPSMGAEKEYEVIVDKPMDHGTMTKLIKGMLTEEGHAKCERAWMMSEYRCHVVLKQGLKRQIRLMFYQLGFEVERLTRTRIGWLELKGLQKGGWKQLTEVEVERFFSKDGMTGRPPKVAKAAAGSKASAAAKDEGDEDHSRPVRRAPKKTGLRSRSSSYGGESKPRGPLARPFKDGDKPRGPHARALANDEKVARSVARSRASRDDDESPIGPRSRSVGGSDRSRGPRVRPFKDGDKPTTKSRGPRARSMGDDERPARGGPRSRPSRDDESPRVPRTRSVGSADRPRSPRSKPSFGGEDRPRGPRARSSGDDEAPRAPRGKRSDGDRKPRSGGSGGAGGGFDKFRSPRQGKGGSKPRRSRD